MASLLVRWYHGCIGTTLNSTGGTPACMILPQGMYILAYPCGTRSLVQVVPWLVLVVPWLVLVVLLLVPMQKTCYSSLLIKLCVRGQNIFKAMC